jgi:hypothetical protein
MYVVPETRIPFAQKAFLRGTRNISDKFTSNAYLALAPGTRPLSKSAQFGSLCVPNCSDQMSCGVLNNSEDDYDAGRLVGI